MSTSNNSLMNNIQPFKLKGTDLYGDWKKWLRTFELTLEAAEINTQKLKFANLLSLAGSNIQEIYTHAEKDIKEKSVEEVEAARTLAGIQGEAEEPVYDNCKLRLEKYFKNYSDPYSAEIDFQNTNQNEDESFNAYFIRLQIAADQCDFGKDREKKILYQIIRGAKYEHVRDKAFEWKDDDLNKILKFAMNYERREEVKSLEKKKRHSFDSESTKSTEVAPIMRGGMSQRQNRPGKESDEQSEFANNYSDRMKSAGQRWPMKEQHYNYRSMPYQPRRGNNFSYRGGRSRGRGYYHAQSFSDPHSENFADCIRCGSWKHLANSPMCPARDKICGEGQNGGCGKRGHFHRQCEKFNAFVKKKQSEQLNQIEDFDDEV